MVVGICRLVLETASASFALYFRCFFLTVHWVSFLVSLLSGSGSISCAITRQLYWCWSPSRLFSYLLFDLQMKSSIPEISISPAPPEAISEEPYSPFSPASFVIPDVDDESFRPHHLTPPPTLISPRFPRQLSPLRPPDSPVVSTGLKRERFEALLRASKERSAAVGTKKAADLRKEIALKAHKSKQG
jgi:hypothetical protein